MKQSEAAKIFKALSSEQRLKLFQLLHRWSKEQEDSKRSKSCCGIEKAFTAACECLKLSRSTISHHFKELQNAGLITCSRQGRSFVCELNHEALTMVKRFLGE